MCECISVCFKEVMDKADKTAKRFNHQYIGTEHILLGIIEEGTGTACEVLKYFGIFDAIKAETEKLMQAEKDFVSIGRLPLTPRARKVIDYAITMCRKDTDTEHLLIALILESEGVAFQVLSKLGLTLEKAMKITLIIFKSRPQLQPEEQTVEEQPIETPEGS